MFLNAAKIRRKIQTAKGFGIFFFHTERQRLILTQSGSFYSHTERQRARSGAQSIVKNKKTLRNSVTLCEKIIAKNLAVSTKYVTFAGAKREKQFCSVVIEWRLWRNW